MNARSQGVLVTELFPPHVGGSAELFANVYSRLNLPVIVLTAARGAPKDLQKRMRIVEVAGSFSNWGALNPKGFAQYVRLAATIRRLSFRTNTVVHCGRSVPEGVAAMLARLSGGPRYVCWSHGEELSYVRRSRELMMLTHWVNRHADGMIANSQNTARRLEDLGVPANRIHVIYPGVDTNRFIPHLPEAFDLRRRIVGENKLVLLTVGRLERRKGHDLTIKALSGVRDTLPHLRYVVVGDGQERARLEALTREHRLEDRVVFVGKVAADSLPAYYAASDIFVHPNRDEDGDFEGFGIVFLEAASAGLPVIAGRSGGAPEAVAENETALLVGGTNVSELQEAILRLASNPPIRKAMGDAGRARAIQAFSW